MRRTHRDARPLLRCAAFVLLPTIAVTGPRELAELEELRRNGGSLEADAGSLGTHEGRLPAGATAPLDDVAFPPFIPRPDHVTRLVANGDGSYSAVDRELPRRESSSEPPPSDAAVGQGLAVLRRSASFLTAQRSLRFRLRYHIDEEGSMGFVGADTVQAIALARPDRFSVRPAPGGPGNSGVVLVGNGDHVLRYSRGRVFAEASPGTLKDITQLSALQRYDGWGLEVDRVLSLLDGDALESLIAQANVVHGGTRQFGGVTVDRVVLRDRNQELHWNRIGWEVFIARGGRPVPLAIRLDQDDTLSYLADRVRFSDSWIHFEDWTFNDVDESTAFTEDLTDVEVVDDPRALFAGEPTELNPMVGRALPGFTARDLSGAPRSSAEVFAERPGVLLLSDDRCHLVGAWWEGIAELAQRYEGRADLTVLHVGSASKEAALAELGRWDAKPDLWLDCSSPGAFAPMMFKVTWTGERVPARVGERIAFLVIGTDGRVHQVVETGTGCFERIAEQLDGLLDGRDMVAVNRASMADEIRRKASQIEELRASFGPRSTRPD
ncbi:MAG: DUF2092 domain-containing protein [Planctomycetota bacterium]